MYMMFGFLSGLGDSQPRIIEIENSPNKKIDFENG
jgi:hypothetical protein